MKPILSVCIPTHNRAPMLKSALASLAPEIAEHNDKVELVVSDNCSPDDTADVVKQAQLACPIRYRRNEKNLGFVYNLVNTVTDFAAGEYCWILGDDDLIRPGAIAKVLTIIEQHPDLDCIFMNQTYEDTSSRSNLPGLGSGADFPDLRNLNCSSTEEFIVPRWEDIISHAKANPIVFANIGAHVFRRSIFIEEAPRIEAYSPREWLTFETVFPHLYLWTPRFIGRPAYYVGYPYMIQFVGHYDWGSNWHRYALIFGLKFADWLETLGADKKVAGIPRSLTFRNATVKKIPDLIFPRGYKLSGAVSHLKYRKEDDWSLLRGILRYWRNKEFGKMVFRGFRDEAELAIKYIRFKIGLRTRLRKFLNKLKLFI